MSLCVCFLRFLETQVYILPMLQTTSVKTTLKEGVHCFALTLARIETLTKNFELVKNGNIRLEITFSEPLTEFVNVIVYSEYQNLIEIDKHRNVFFDYGA